MKKQFLETLENRQLLAGMDDGSTTETVESSIISDATEYAGSLLKPFTDTLVCAALSIQVAQSGVLSSALHSYKHALEAGDEKALTAKANAEASQSLSCATDLTASMEFAGITPSDYANEQAHKPNLR